MAKSNRKMCGKLSIASNSPYHLPSLSLLQAERFIFISIRQLLNALPACMQVLSFQFSLHRLNKLSHVRWFLASRFAFCVCRGDRIKYLRYRRGF
jgi:hypothetical protein